MTDSSGVSRRDFVLQSAVLAGSMLAARSVPLGAQIQQGPVTGPMVLWYKRPASQWVEALPIGNARSQAYKRLSGWAFVLSGLAYAAAWAFAPMDMAATLSMAPMGIAMVTVFVVCMSNRIGSTKAAD